MKLFAGTHGATYYLMRFILYTQQHSMPPPFRQILDSVP